MKYTVIVWAVTLFIGFWVSPTTSPFHIRSATTQMVLFPVVCTHHPVFLTSNIHPHDLVDPVPRAERAA